MRDCGSPLIETELRLGLVVLLAACAPGCARSSGAEAAPTFTRDVAPILFRHCAPCHHPGGAGPFSLLTFADARRRARQIAKVTSSRYMPPWPPERGHSRFVGEGLTEWRGQLIQLTPMRTRQNVIRSLILDNLKVMGAPFLDRDSGVVYDIHSLEPKSTFGYNIEGWGLTHDDHQLIKSDGTSILRFLNPDSMKWQAQIAVVEAGKGIRWLNELEYINGEVYANIWQQDRIAIIQLNSGQVTGWIDLSQLRPRMIPPPKDIEGLGAYGKAVANGIAYDAAGGRLFVTGKNWSRLFEIRLRN